MGTRAAAFTAKIKNLQDYYLRLLHGIPLPSELDIACTLKYFSLTLMGVLKDVPEAPLEMLRRPDQDSTRLALYPSLDYTGLYRALVQLFDIVPLLQYGVHGFGQSLLHTMSCLVPFLEHSLIDSLPYLVASSLATFPISLHRDIVNTLCHYLLPFTLSPDVENYTSSSITAIVMVVFQYTDQTALHCQLLETVMSRRLMVIRDLFCIIAHGTVSARLPAAHLLFHYWPALNPTSADRRNNLLKFTGLDAEEIGWEPHQCERDNCPSNENNEAIQLCLDHNVAVLQGSEYPPPLYLCQHCSQDIRSANSQISMFEILLPMQHISTTCENKNCRSSDKLAMCTCFAIECASYNGNRPIRYCAQCDSIRHNNRRGGDHVVQYRIGSPWKMAPDVSRYMVEAVVSLLKEAQPLADSRRSREQERHTRAGLLDESQQPEGPSLEERRSLSRYGVWLLVNLCTPDRTTPDQTLARLLAALFNWFEATAYLGDDQAGGALELLKSEYIHSWLQAILADNFKTFASCLLPRPPEYARVGGHWDGLVSKTQHIQEGFHRLFCLVPYDIISAELWNHIMPNWLEAILQDVPEDELPELKIILSKLLDPDMSPLGFDADQMYQFVSVRFHSSAPRVQEQALTWLQILSMVNIAIPLPILHKMLRTGVRCLQASKDGSGARKVSSIRSQVNNDLGPVVQSESRAASPLSGEDCMPEEEVPVDTVDTADLVVPCYLLMLDVLLKQMEIQDIAQSQGLQSSQSQQAVILLKAMLSSPTEGKHTCDPGDTPPLETYRENGKDEPVRVEQCDACEALLELYQLAGELLAYICPQETIKAVEISEEPAETGVESPADEPAGRGVAQEKPAAPVQEHVISMDGLQQHVIQPSQVMMATEEVTEMDVAASMPAERVVRAVAKAVTISEDDIAVAKVKVCAARLVGENDQPVIVPTIEEGDNFWTTSHGRFRFTVDELPPELQLLYGLLNRMKECDDQDVTSHLLACLRLLVLHADCLQRAARDHRGFHIWCQENLVIKQLWDLLLAEYSQIPEIAVPVLLHAITLPCGADVFWQIVGNEFRSDDWKVRFTAVERATVLARFLEPSVVWQSGPALQPSLAHVFSYLIHAVDDLSAAVAQKVQLYMETIPDGGIRTICMCLETQFDTVIVDRPLVLKTVLQLFHLLPSRGILSWEFFNSRFDSLVLETQIRLERRGDIPLTKDMKADGAASEAYIRRLTRAHEALTVAASGSGHRRTLNSSIGTKWPYKRAMSAPAVVPRPDKNDVLKHAYPRQASAPTLNRKASRFGYSQMNHAPENSRSSAPTAGGWDSLPLVYRSLDSDQGDRETTHLLVDLLMKYMARPDQAPPGDDKQQCRSQQLALRHLAMTLGFNQTDKTFFMSPARLRSKAAFNAFLSQLNHVLDYNFPLGGALLPLCLPVLLYGAAPSRQSAVAPGRPSYSLWHLEERQRHDWLAALLTVLYKKERCPDSLQYQYGDPALSTPLLALCQIVLNTLHLCRPPAETPASAAAAAAAAATPLSRIGSLQPGVVAGSPPGPTERTPPVTPRPTLAQELVPPPPPPPPPAGPPGFGAGPEDWRCGRPDAAACYGCEENDIEPELEAIPESPKTPSSHQSFCDSLVELDALEEVPPVQAVQPIRVNSSFTGLGVAEMAQSVCITNELASLTPQVATVSSELVKATVVTPEVANVRSELLTATMATPEVANIRSELVTATMAAPEVANVRSELLTATMATPEMANVRSELVTATVATPEVANVRSELVTATVAAPEVATVMQPTEVACQQVHQLHTASFSVLEETAAELEPCPPAVMVAAHSQPPAAPAPGRRPSAPFTHSMSLDAQPSPAESWQPPRARSLAVPRPAEQTAGDGAERSLLERLSLVFSKQESHAPGSAGRLMLQLGADGRQPRDVASETLANQSSASTEDDAATPGDEPAVHRAYIKQPKSKKLGLSPVEQAAADSRTARWARRDRPGEEDKPVTSMKQCSLRVGHDCVLERCADCGQVREDYTEEELGLCVVVLATFVHREPSLAACLLPDMLRAVSGLAARQRYPWQSESSYSLSGSVNSVCRQFLRCVLHRLAAHNMFFKLFQADMDVDTTHAFFRTLAQALADFAELNPAAPLHHLLEYLNRQRSAPCLDEIPAILYNMSVYLECISLETGGAMYGPLVTQLDALLHRLLPCLTALPELDSLLAIMCSVLKIPNVNVYKTVLDSFSKVVSLLVQTRPIDYRRLVELCHLCNRVFSREREKQQLSRVVVFELVQALKFKSNPPDTNLLLLVHFVVQDAGGTMAPSTVLDLVPDLGTDTAGATAAAECMRQHMNDALDFLADVHTLTKIKSNCSGPLRGLNEDTMGGVLKAGVAQFVALEISRGNSRENRAVSRYLPWLYNPPSPVQQGPKEFIDCVSHIRLLSWLLLGAMTHATVLGPQATVTCQPVPLDASCHIADHIQVILAGFAEQSKASVLHMSSLFHAFILCQLWTMYLEVVSAGQPPPVHEQHAAALAILADFWAKVTPGILQLVSHSRVLGEMVNLHFLSLMEALAECNASTLARLLPVWTQVFYAYNEQLPGHLSVRLQSCQSQPAGHSCLQQSPAAGHGSCQLPTCAAQQAAAGSAGAGAAGGGGRQEGGPAQPAAHSNHQLLLSWIQRLQFKMGQIELQSSAAAQFYTV